MQVNNANILTQKRCCIMLLHYEGKIQPHNDRAMIDHMNHQIITK